MLHITDVCIISALLYDPALACVRPNLDSRSGLICLLFDLRPFQVILKVHTMFWLSVVRVWSDRRIEQVGWGWQKFFKDYPEKLHSKDTDTRAIHW